jgi:oligoendopeptidase F
VARPRRACAVARGVAESEESDVDWDLTAYFPEFGGEQHTAFEAALERDAATLSESLAGLPALGPASYGPWEAALDSYEAIGARFAHLRSYVGALASADGNDARYRAAEARLSSLRARLTALEARFIAALGALDDAAFDAWLAASPLADARYFLSRWRERATRSMAPEREALAAELGTDGIEAWGRLYDRLTSTLTFKLKQPDGSERELPISARRSLMEGPDRSVRQAAFAGGNRAFASVAPTLAAALNHIAGTRLTLYRQRGIAHFLEPALFDAGISRAALDALYVAVERQVALPRRVLALKARALGVPALAWYDLGAPFPSEVSRRIEWNDAIDMVARAFDHQYPKLGSFFMRGIERRWVDHRSRPGKRPGAFCTSSPLLEESRVFMTFQGTFNEVSTLAHEMGHAFHNHVMQGVRFYARRYPMTLAESASTFAELLLADGLAAQPGIDPRERRALEASLLNDASTFLLDITARFRFEQAFYEERRRGEVEVERLNELMASTQRDVFGEALDPAQLDPLFWASKLHFFITGVSFYNFPYTFGYLLSRGMFAEFKRRGAEFLPRYEEFLRRSGSDDAPRVARDVLGVELEQPDFWERSITSVAEPLARFEASL